MKTLGLKQDAGLDNTAEQKQEAVLEFKNTMYLLGKELVKARFEYRNLKKESVRLCDAIKNLNEQVK